MTGHADHEVAHHHHLSPDDTHGCGHHLLLAGGLEDVAQLRRLVDHAPACAYGQVVLEVEADTDAAITEGWDLPDGVSLTVLRHPRGRPSRRRRGRLLTAAVSAWASEWLADDACACDGPFALWVGCAGCPEVENLCHRIADRCEAVSAHLHRPRS